MTTTEISQITKGDTRNVLDHGYVRLIDFLGKDEVVIEAARMSTDGGFVSWEPYEGHKGGDQGLLDYLWRKKHATPFEMCEAVFEVQAPIMVFREWMRARTQSYNEMSGRYIVMPNLHYVPSAERLAAIKNGNKQATSLDHHLGGEMSEEDLADICQGIHDEQIGIYIEYEKMLKAGVPKEVARINTPVSRYSRMRVKTDLRNWFWFLNLRMRPNAQWEIRQYANMIAGFLSRLFPRSFALFEEYDLYGVSLSRTEIRILRAVVGGAMSLREATEEFKLTGSKKEEFLAKLQKGGEEILA
jgi:thymidylate synthase (FAD)